MSRKYKIILYVLFCLATVAYFVWFLKTNTIAVLDPKGIIAHKQRDLLQITTLLMLIVVIPALFLAFFFTWKYKEGKKSKYTPDWDNDILTECIWWAFPSVIVIILSVLTWKSCHELDPYAPIVSDVKPIEIQVVALQWKWLFIYPEQNIASLNFVQFPEKVPIDFKITSDAPMNSFWIPQLGGQIYAMAGMSSELHLMADEPGTFRGCSANLSGIGFSGMSFDAKALTAVDFESWVESVKASSKTLNFESYQELVKPSENNPVSIYKLETQDLYHQILMKYMPGN